MHSQGLCVSSPPGTHWLSMLREENGYAKLVLVVCLPKTSRNTHFVKWWGWILQLWWYTLTGEGDGQLIWYYLFRKWNMFSEYLFSLRISPTFCGCLAGEMQRTWLTFVLLCIVTFTSPTKSEPHKQMDKMTWRCNYIYSTTSDSSHRVINL